ncbi:40S ribosomal protein S20 [Culex quinquefasciatus]|uniref:40S ribosomal protein S20 n=1 Tax=Culex quinquefasciatus TaxID=7176 RepID=B0XEK5_CULQU|nr:40S ribosomal protein S20 [Culex quinquefasciatus]EDS27019.1 40S ribosomal protein S20 [Culex quinquefasciatus]|eukprot:XP_001868077.1 40S ribosomal protein S20 [Culex quinquefasciatus]
MAATRKDIEKAATIHRNHVTLTLRNVRSLEKVCADLISGAKKQKLRVKGPVRMPTKILRITIRLALMMRLHKRIIDLHSPSEIVKQITSINIYSPV